MKLRPRKPQTSTVTNLLDVAAGALFVSAAAVIWWPAALVVGGLCCAAISWRHS